MYHPKLILYALCNPHVQDWQMVLQVSHGVRWCSKTSTHGFVKNSTSVTVSSSNVPVQVRKVSFHQAPGCRGSCETHLSNDPNRWYQEDQSNRFGISTWNPRQNPNSTCGASGLSVSFAIINKTEPLSLCNLLQEGTTPIRFFGEDGTFLLGCVLHRINFPRRGYENAKNWNGTEHCMLHCSVQPTVPCQTC